MPCACSSARRSCTAPIPSSSRVFALFFMLRISPWLTLVALAPMPLASILVQYFGSRIHDRFERIQASFSDISAQAQENYSGVRLIRAFAREESADRPLRAPQPPVHRPRPAPRSAHGHALAHARIHPRHFHDHHPAGRRASGPGSTTSPSASSSPSTPT